MTMREAFAIWLDKTYNDDLVDYLDEYDFDAWSARLGWEAACKWQRECIADMFADAIQSDLENGVKWLNENAYSEFTRKYPEINKLFGKLNKELFNEHD